MRVLSEEMRRAKLAKLVDLEGFEDEAALFAAGSLIRSQDAHLPSRAADPRFRCRYLARARPC